jgi:hypothetical protein
LCGARNHRLNKQECKKRKQRFIDREFVIASADAELCDAGLIKPVRLRNRYSEYEGMSLILPDGSRHFIPKDAPPHTFFEIPESFYTSGAGAIWRRKDYGLHPLPEDALRLLIALLSEHDVRRYGGVNPALLAFRNGELVIGGILADWETLVIATALSTLIDRGFVSRQPCTVSSIDGHCIRLGFTAAHADEQDLEILVVRTQSD